jgi:spore coat protein U-like protein
MTKFVRLAALAAAATVVATPAVAAPVSASPTASANVRILKPLELRGIRNLDFGTIVVGAVVGTDTVSISQAGVVTCGTGGQLTCSGTTASGQYNVRGSNNAVVTITAVASNLSNGTDNLLFTPKLPNGLLTDTVTLTSSGAPGNNFTVAGSIDLTAATVEGLYTGVMNVTVDYQ